MTPRPCTRPLLRPAQHGDVIHDDLAWLVRPHDGVWWVVGDMVKVYEADWSKSRVRARPSKECQEIAYAGSFMAGGGVNPAFAAIVLALRPTAVGG